ncbi:MAG TPA: hypothetical protein V6C81_01845 [Planktothrix sp.]|jgi:lipopolysaccharide transport system permease protein
MHLENNSTQLLDRPGTTGGVGQKAPTISQIRLEFGSDSPLLSPKRFVTDGVRDLLSAREAAYRLFRSSIALRYKRSSLGLFWAFAPTILMAATVTVGQKAHLTAFASTGVPPQFYAIFGLVLLQTFLDAFNALRLVFVSNRTLLFHHRTIMEASLLAGLGDNLFALSLRFLLLIGVFLLCGVVPAATAVVGLVGLLILAGLGATCGLLVAPLNGVKGDLNHLAGFLPLLLMACTPVVVKPPSGSFIESLCRLNPLTGFFDAVRAFSYGHATVADVAVFVTVTILVIVSLPASWMFCRIARSYVLERSII